MSTPRGCLSRCLAGLQDGASDDEFIRERIAVDFRRWQSWVSSLVILLTVLIFQIMSSSPAAYILYGFVLTDWIVFSVTLGHALRLANRLRSRRDMIAGLLATPIPVHSYLHLFTAAPMRIFFGVTTGTVLISFLLSLPIGQQRWSSHDILQFLLVSLPGVPILIWFHGNSIALAFALSLPVITEKASSAYHLGRCIAAAILICATLTGFGIGITIVMVYIMMYAGDRPLNGGGPIVSALGILAVFGPGLLTTGWMKARLAQRGAARFVAALPTIGEES